MADFPLQVVPPSLSGIAASPLMVLRKDTPVNLAGSTDGGAAVLQVDALGALRTTQEGGLPTYIANSQFACDSTGTDIWRFPGVATKTVKILWLRISSVATTAIAGRIAALLRSTANTAGTPVASGLVKLDQRNGTPVSAPSHYTAHPTALGTQIGTGNLVSEQYLQNVVGSTVNPNTVLWDFRNLVGAQGLRLSGTAEILVLNVAAALGGSGNLWDVTAAFTESPTTA